MEKSVITSDLDALQRFFNTQTLDQIDALLQPKPRQINSLQHFRSALMLSAHNLKHLNKINSLDSDCVILNLEDGVNKELKPIALRQCAFFLSQLITCKKKLVVRVNPLDEGGEDEIRYLNAFQPDAVRIPKVRSIRDVQRALELLDDKIELHLSIETKEAWQNLSSLAVHKRVTAFYLGVLDLFADLKLPQELIEINNPTMHYILSHFLITCKSVDVQPVSFVFQQYHDMKRFKAWVNLEKKMGFRSKGCLSPSQVDSVNEIFMFDDTAISRAKKIVTLFEKRQSEGVSGFSDDELGFIDEPIYKGALSLLQML